VGAASERNFAFIDGQNLHVGVTHLGWKLDWRRFRVYLQEHYRVARAFYFLGYIPDNQAVYTRLQNASYTLVFKTVTYRGDGKPKGNVDAELVLQAMIEYPQYERAVIVTGDADFGCLVRYLYQQDKLERVISPNGKQCSALLKRAARERLDFLEAARGKIEYKNEGAPPQDVT
jgi:uncharacterized LabA/DUF88 family protein